VNALREVPHCRAKQPRSGDDVEMRHCMRDIHDHSAGADAGDHAFALADGGIAGAEISHEGDNCVHSGHRPRGKDALSGSRLIAGAKPAAAGRGTTQIRSRRGQGAATSMRRVTGGGRGSRVPRSRPTWGVNSRAGIGGGAFSLGRALSGPGGSPPRSPQRHVRSM
jgi:hypothetical protein